MPSFFDEWFGAKPNVPKLERTDLVAEQQKAVQANINIAPKARELAMFTRDQIDAMLAGAGGGSLLKDSAGQIGKMVAGELPLSDRQSSELRSIAKSFGGGTAGGGAMGNLVARDLGRRITDQISEGIGHSGTWFNTFQNLYSPATAQLSSMWITPQQSYAAENEQRTQQFQRNWMKSQVAAAPDPMVSGLMNMGTGLLTGAAGGGL